MDSTLSGLVEVVIPAVAIVAVFTFIAVASWSDNRRRERESYYRHETLRKAMEQPGESSSQILALMREEENRRERKRVEGLRLGGLITTVSGIGIMVFLAAMETEEPAYLVGGIPLLIGLVLTIHGFTRRSPDP